MEKSGWLMDSVLLLDNYGEESSMLRQSFRKAGFKGPVIVIEDDGFSRRMSSQSINFSAEISKQEIRGKQDFLTRSMSQTTGKSAETILMVKYVTCTMSVDASFMRSQNIKDWCAW